MKIANMEQLIASYDGFLIDLWGVVHDGYHPYPGAVDCLNQMIAAKKNIIFLSNAPHPSDILVKKLVDFGIHANVDMMLSSGDITRYQLCHFQDSVFKNRGHCFYHLGAERNQTLLQNLTVDTTENLAKADFILLTQYLDEGEDLHQFDEFFKLAIARSLPLICTNPDTVLLNLGKYRYCAGFLAERYEQLGGRVRYYGKPYPEIYQSALTRFQQQGIQHKHQIVAIGDTLETDVAGAVAAGVDSAIVMTGNVARLTKEDALGRSSLEILPELMKARNLSPNWLVKGLCLKDDLHEPHYLEPEFTSTLVKN